MIFYLLKKVAPPLIRVENKFLQNLAYRVLTTKLILLDSLLQEVEATLPHLVLQKRKENDTERRRSAGGVKGGQQGVDPQTESQVWQDRP